MNKQKTIVKGMKQKRSIFLTLLISYLLIFLIPVIIGCIVYLKIEKIMIVNAYRTNSAMLKQIKHVMNGRTQEIDNLMKQIAFHPKQQYLMLKGAETITSKDQYQYIEFMKELSRYSTYNTMNLDFYVYFGNTDTVLTPTMKANASTFFQSINHYSNMNYEDFKANILLGNHFKSYLRTQMTVNGLKNESMITYVQSLPFGEEKHAVGSLVIQLNENQIRGYLQEIEGLHEGIIYILNENKDILVGPNDNHDAIDVYKKRLNNKDGGFLQVNNGEEMFVSYTTSSENGWTYLSIFPKKVVLDQVGKVKKWSLLAVFVCLVIGSTLCIYLTRRHYTPIRDVVRVIMNGRSGLARNERNEMKLIKETVQSLFGIENELQNKLSLQMPIIRSDFLLRLVRGQVDTISIKEEDLSFMGVSFAYDWFTLVIIDIEESSKFMKEDTEREWVLIRFITINLSNEMLAGNGYAFELGKTRILILMNLGSNAEEVNEQCQEFVQRLMAVMWEKFKTSITIGLSSHQQGMDKITACYDEAMMAISYKVIQGTHSILDYNEVGKWESASYHYPMELEVQLTNYTKNGDSENMQRLLESIYQVNFNHNRLSPDMVRWLFMELQSTLLKLMDTVRLDYNQIFNNDRDIFYFMTETATTELMFKQIKGMYHEICLNIKEERTDHSVVVYEKITRFIEEHYHDHNLGLSMLSDQLKLNPIYISAFFKKHSGDNITNFITAVRIQHVKDFLREEMTVQEIAQRVGYSNNILIIPLTQNALVMGTYV